jgi:hypothetical protein
MLPVIPILPNSPLGVAVAQREQSLRRAIESLLVDPFVIDVLRLGAAINADTVRLDAAASARNAENLAVLGIRISANAGPAASAAPAAHSSASEVEPVEVPDCVEPIFPEEMPEPDIPFEASPRNPARPAMRKSF